MRVDFSTVKEIEPIPAGAYLVELTKVEEKDGPKGTYYSWELTVVNSGDYDGRKLFTITSLSEGALGILRNFLFACEVLSDPKSKEAIDFEVDQLIGKIICVKVVQESYDPQDGSEPRLQNRVKGYMRAS